MSRLREWRILAWALIPAPLAVVLAWSWLVGPHGAGAGLLNLLPPAGMVWLADAGSTPASPSQALGNSSTPEQPAHPLQQAAAKALRGDYGPLQPWQQKAWRAVVVKEKALSGDQATCATAWLTHYGPPHHPRGDLTRWGYHCSESTLAANKLRAHSLAILELPMGYEVRRVEDTGAKSNDARARRHGADLWLDRWHPRPRGAYNVTFWRVR